MDNGKTLYIYEASMARLERANKRLWIVVIILIAVLLATNAGWLYYNSQFEQIETHIEAQQDGDGLNIVGGGDVNYGAESEDHNQGAQT